MKKRKEFKEAAVIKYTKEQSAPKIVAMGKGIVAENIIKKAEEEDVPIHYDSNLAHTLNMLQLGDEIPTELYEIVAQILIFVSDIDKLKDNY